MFRSWLYRRCDDVAVDSGTKNREGRSREGTQCTLLTTYERVLSSAMDGSVHGGRRRNKETLKDN
jgi:hypothetical protein